MALATSIKFNEKDVRSAFGLEVMDIQGIGTSRTNVGAIETFGMPGAKAGISKHGAKGIKLTGYIEGTSHSDLLAKIDSMNKEISFGYHGLQTLRLTISDYTDRYYEARCLDVKITPIHPRFSSFFVNVEIMFGIDDPYALYSTLTLAGVTAYLTPTISLSVDIGGSAIARPRIRIYNDGTTFDDLHIYTIATRNKLQTISTTTENVASADGRWGDMYGAAKFEGANDPRLKFTALGVFNPECFTVVGYVYEFVGAAGGAGYLFDTTGNKVRCYHDTGNSKWVFEVDGTSCEITDATSGFTHSEWWAIGVARNGADIYLQMWNISTENGYWQSATGASYKEVPTDVFIGQRADGAEDGDHYIDDLRFYNYKWPGMGSTPSAGSLWTDFKTALRPLPIGKGCCAYFDFDYKTNGVGLEGTNLNITESIASGKYFDIDSEKMIVNLVAANMENAPASIMDNVSGEFPVLTAGVNGIQITTDTGDNIDIGIETARRFV